MAESNTSPELYRPDQLPDLVEDPEFTALKFEDRKTVFEKGVEESAAWIGRNGGWTPETFTDFRQSVRALRGRVEESENMGETVMGGLRTIGRTIKDSAAVAGTVLADTRFADAQDGDVKLRVPLSDVGSAFSRNMDKLTDSTRTAFGKTKGGADEAVEAQLSALDEAIDRGEFLQGDTKAWLKQQADVMDGKVRDYYRQQRVDPDSEAEYLGKNRLDSAQNVPLVMRYIATASPAARTALREQLLKLPMRAAKEAADETATRESDTGKFLDDVFGEGASRYVSEAGDPLEVLGNLTAFLGGKALVTAGKAALKGAGKTALKSAGKAATGMGVDTAGELGSLFMENPNAAPAEYAATAREAAVASLGLGGVGAVTQVAINQFSKPEASHGNTSANQAAAVQESTAPAAQAAAAPAAAPVSAGHGVLQQMADAAAAVAEGARAAAAPGVETAPDYSEVPIEEDPAKLRFIPSEESGAIGIRAEVTPPPAPTQGQFVSAKPGEAPSLPPQFKGALDHGLALVKQGVRDFAAWSVEMVKQFGEAIREYLQGMWAAATKGSQSGAVQLGGTVQKQASEEGSAAAGTTAAAAQAAGSTGLPPGDKAPVPGEPTETRSFGARVAQDPRMNPKVRAQAEQQYAPVSNEMTLGQANALIDERGLAGAAALVRDGGNGLPEHVRVALGMQVMLRMDAAAREARNAGDLATAAGLWQQVGEIGGFVDKLGTAAGRAVQAFAMWARMTPEGLLTSFESRLKERNNGTVPALPKELLVKLGGLRDKIHALPAESPLRADLMREMMNELALHEGLPVGSIFGALWYANLLSGLTTQGMNVMGNVFGMVLRSLAAGLVNHPSDTLRMLAGYMRGLPRAWAEARAAFAGKVDSRNTQDTPTVGEHVKRNALEVALSGKPTNWKTWMAWVLSVGGLTKYVGRLMTGMDAAFYYTAAEGRAHLAASRAARKGHRPGTPAFVRAMADQLGRGEAPWAAALADAEQQLRTAGKPVTATAKMRIAYAMLDAQRPVALREEAGRFGDLVTAQQEPEGIGASIYNIAKAIQENVPVLGRALVPFARILANLTSNGLDFTPVGVIRGIRGKHLIKPKKEFAAWERWERGSAGALGTAAGIYLLAKALEHEEQDDETVPFMMYGAGPKSPGRREQMPKGWKPFTIKVRGHYISYAETPLVYILAPMGAIMDARRYHKDLDERSMTDRFTYYAQSILKTTMSQGVTSSMGDALGMMNGEVPIAKLPSRVTAGFIPGQGFLRDVTALFDPTKISDDHVAASMLRDVPVARHWFGHPARDYMGDVITYEGLARIPVVKRFLTDQRDTDPDKTWVGRNKLTVPAWPKTVEAGDYLTEKEKIAAKAARIDAGMFTTDEQDQFVKRAGELTREQVKILRRNDEDARARGLPSVDREVLQKQMDAKVRAARRMAMRELIWR